MLLSLQTITLKEATLRPCLVGNVRDSMPFIMPPTNVIQVRARSVHSEGRTQRNLSNFNEIIRLQLHESPFKRLPCDDIPDQPILVYKYLKDDFLSLVKRGISMRTRKQILRH